MPPDVAESLDRYLTLGNVSAVARELGIPRITVQKWAERWQFRAIAADMEASAVRDAIAAGRRRWADAIPDAVSTIVRASRDRFGADGKPEPGAVTPTALKAAITLVSGSGALSSRIVHDTGDVAAAAASLDRVSALLASGDTAALLAIATGQPATADLGADRGPAATRLPGGGRLPGDFASDQPGGRVVPGSSPGDTQAETADVIEAVVRANRREPAPERWYDPEGETFTEHPNRGAS